MCAAIASRRRLGARALSRGFENLEVRAMLTTAPTVVDLHIASSDWTPAFMDHLASQGHGDLGFRIPVGSAQSKSLPWFNLDEISISFSEDVHVDESDLSLSGVNATTFAVEAFGYFSDAATGRHVAIWRFASPLPKNFYQIDLDANGIDPVVDDDGNVLDGEWTNNSDAMPSGNGTAGGDFQFVFRVMPGDVNQSSTVEYIDYYAATTRFGATPGSSNYVALVDVDGNGVIQTQDAQAIQSKLWSTYPSGTPVGATNDAPTAALGGAVQITNPAADVVMSLWNAFADQETPDSQLSYQIASNSNPGLFDSVSINTSTGNLVLNAASGVSGRSEIKVTATDSAGLRVTTTFVAHVIYQNVAPYLNFTVIVEGYNTWRFVGYVTDDGPLEQVVIQFTGVIDVRTTVRADGTFEFALIIEEEGWGSVTGNALDLEGVSSEDVVGSVGIS
jgi:hypothetical protein